MCVCFTGKITVQFLLMMFIINIIEYILNCVDGLLKDENNLGRRNLLLKVKALVNGTAIPDFVNDFNRGRFRFSVYRKIQEIDDALDEVYVMGLNLTPAQQAVMIQDRKSRRNQAQVMQILLCGLLGCELAG